MILCHMLLKYINHSGFVIKGEGFALLFDYYKDTPDRYVHEHFLQFPGQLYILASHAHPDHFNPEVLEWHAQREDLRYIFSRDIRRKMRHSPVEAIFLRKGEEWEDPILKIKAFGSTDAGVSFLVKTGGMRIFHAGDLNCWHWDEESSPGEIRQAEHAWQQELDAIVREVPALNLALFPIDPRLGKNYMRGAQEFVDKIKVHHFAPMHCWEQYDKANAFRPYVEGRGGKFIPIHQPGEITEII